MVEAPEIKVPDIAPAGIGEFLLEFHYPDKKPVKNSEFGYSVNNGEVRNAGTDDQGLLRVRVTGPPRIISLSLPDSATAAQVAGTIPSDARSSDSLPDSDTPAQVSGSTPSTTGEFPVELCSPDQQPVKNIGFGYSVDNGETQAGTTDEHGVLRVGVNQPPRVISLSLPV